MTLVSSCHQVDSSSLKCTKTWSARAQPLTPLRELTTLPRPSIQLGMGGSAPDPTAGAYDTPQTLY